MNEYKDINEQNYLLFKNLNYWMTTKEAAEYIRTSPASLRNKISRGEISPSGRLGRSLRFRRDVLDKYLEAPLKGVTND